VDVAALAHLLPDYVRRQRWYGRKDAGDGVHIEGAQELDGLTRLVVASGPERYQLFLGRRPAAEADASTVGEAAAVGVVHDSGQDWFCYDATVDPVLDLALLEQVAPGEEATTARPIGVEQSNTSVVYDERLILKLFRRLNGANPEIEVTAALAGQGFEHIAPPLAVWRDGGDDLAVLQPFLAGGSEGWALALTSLRDLLARAGDDDAEEPSGPEQAGGDMAPEAARLGEVTAEMHVAMAAAFGSRPGQPAGWADAIEARLEAVHHPDIDHAAVRRALDRLRALPDAGAEIRVHGDLHLGQVMRTDDGWFILDFEGEPTRPVAERRRATSPMRDVAGMVRSFAYAAGVATREQDGPAAGEWAAAWERRNRDAFLAAYFARLDGTGLLPADPDAVHVLLTAFELDKAVYEVAYEQAHRPDWVGIPLSAVSRLLSS